MIDLAGLLVLEGQCDKTGMQMYSAWKGPVCEDLGDFQYQGKMIYETGYADHAIEGHE